MLKVLLIDDEPIVREGLKTIINWEENGFFICGEAVDGRTGLNKILCLKPDLVLMDIRMPGINGIDAIKKAKEDGYKGKFIILSGYSDFKYAQSAVRLGVSSYILKPIDELELIESIKSIALEISNDVTHKKCMDMGEKQLKDDILRNIVMKSVSINNLLIQSYNLNFEFDYFEFIIIDTTSDENFRIIANYFCNCENADVFKIEDRPVLIFKGYSDINESNIIQNLYKELLRANESMFIAIGRLIKSIEELSISYKDAVGILNNRFLYEELHIVHFEDIICVNENVVIKSIDNNMRDMSYHFERLYTAIEVGDIEKINKITAEVGDYFRKQKYTSEKIKGICVNMVSGIIEKTILNYEEFKNNPVNESIIGREIYNTISLQKLILYINNEFILISNKICNTSPQNTMKRILNYIEKNYYKDLKLEFLAEIFCYNSAYLGKMFKNYTGEGFNGYLDKIRMEKAKLLLEQGELKVYQVSEKVGYKSIDYFYSKFKKHFGVSPKKIMNV
ncbi:response regulator [Clostridium lacusfryxellense]|uniref:response regulator n=1 Tax=Clostridium lacusfryxellense TaxID=205328 RepID=UPI001C0B4F0D|nr:response regulator [Clostridium lacusfryxellense]MBU3112209.1 response regulator [Clostridium lacusfryxellense]